MHFVFREFEFSVADVFIGEEFDFLEADHLRADEHVAVGARRGSRDAFFFRDFEHADLRVADRVRVVIDVHRLDVRLALVEIEMVDVILLALVEVNRFGMDGRERGGKIDFADHFRLAVLLARSIDDDEIVGRDGTQADGIRGIGLLHPVPVAAAAMEVARFAKALAKLLHVDGTEFVIGRDRQLEGRAFQVIHEDFEIVRLHVGVFGRAAEKIIGMLHDELIERRGRRDEHGAGSAVAAAGAASALPRGRNRAGVARHHAGVERADVDAQFERVGRDHSADAPFAQAALDLAALAGQDSRRDSRESARAAPGCGWLACCRYVSRTSVCRRLLAKTIVCSFRARSSFATRVVSFR